MANTIVSEDGEVYEVEEPSSLRIQSKVAGATVATSVSIIVVWLVQVSFGVEIPEHVSQAITGVLAFVGGYIAKT